jgi:hypothetical protein
MFAMSIVFATYNATGYSYYHWITNGSNSNNALKLFCGVSLVTIYCVFGTALWRSVGPVGMACAMAAFLALVSSLTNYGLLDLHNTNAVPTVFNILLATVLSVGVSWSHVRTRLTGHVDAKDVASR